MVLEPGHLASQSEAIAVEGTSLSDGSVIISGGDLVTEGMEVTQVTEAGTVGEETVSGHLVNI